jgi:glycosyltransferase involved in cell wall biosynthesis
MDEKNLTIKDLVRSDAGFAGSIKQAIKPAVTSLSIVMPFYNEEANIEHGMREAIRVVDALEIRDYEVIAVDDGSADRTREIARQWSEQNPHIRLVAHDQNKGYGEALKSGFRAARKTWVFYTDGDGQFDLNQLPALIEKTTVADIVSGVRIHRADPWYRKLNAGIFSFALRLFMGLDIPDVDCAFKIYRREIFDRLALKTSGALIDAEVLLKARRAGYRITTMPVQHKPRNAGAPTGANGRVILRAMKEFWQLWADLYL